MTIDCRREEKSYSDEYLQLRICFFGTNLAYNVGQKN